MNAEEVWDLALALPQAEQAPHFDYVSFRVRGKIFATVPPDLAHLHVFVGPDEIDPAIAEHPAAVTELWWGKQRVGVRIAVAEAHAEQVGRLLQQAWRRKAPKRL